MNEYSQALITIATRLFRKTNNAVEPYDEDRAERLLERFILDNMSKILDKLFEYYTPLFDAVKQLGYTVERNGHVVYLKNFSPAGEELLNTFFLDSEDDIPFQIYMLSEHFDIEDHAYAVLEYKSIGTTDVPSIQSLIDDAVKIADMYETLYTIACRSRIDCSKRLQA